MQLLVERRYIFLRRQPRGRVTMAALAVALTGLSVQVAEARPDGGYRIDHAVEAAGPAVPASGDTPT